MVLPGAFKSCRRGHLTENEIVENAGRDEARLREKFAALREVDLEPSPPYSW